MRWIELAHERVAFQGLPSRICWLGYGDRAKIGLLFNELVRTGKVKAPIVIGRDHLDCGSVASPYRETEAMKDGSDAIADFAILNALVNTAARRVVGELSPRRRRGDRQLAARGDGRRRRRQRRGQATTRTGAHDRSGDGHRSPCRGDVRRRHRVRRESRRSPLHDEERMTGSILLSLGGVMETLAVSAPTVVDAVRGRVTRELCDARLKNWAKRLLDGAEVTRKVVHPERAATSEIFVVMSNHRSLYDIPLIMESFPRTLRMVAKTELFRVPIWGGAMRAGGVHRARSPQPHSAPSKASTSLGRASNRASTCGSRRKGRAVAPGELGPFKGGGFRLALDTGLRILPVGIRGTERDPPRRRRTGEPRRVRRARVRRARRPQGLRGNGSKGIDATRCAPRFKRWFDGSYRARMASARLVANDSHDVRRPSACGAPKADRSRRYTETCAR